MSETLEVKVGAAPSLSTLNYEQFQKAAEMKRKEAVPKVTEKYHSRCMMKKIAAAAFASGAIFLSGMYVGAKYSNELAEAGSKVRAYFSQTAEAAENQNKMYNGGK